MKVQLVVVRGKPEGKVIPSGRARASRSAAVKPVTCGRTANRSVASTPNSPSTAKPLSVRDLGSRNGTLVNGKALTADACRLKDRDLVQVGPLTFAVAILGAPAAAAKAAASAGAPSPHHPMMCRAMTLILG